MKQADATGGPAGWAAALRQGIAVGVVSFALLALQIALMQGLAHAHGHHLAYIVISIALLGFGASGSFLHVWRARAADADRRLPSLFLPSLLLCAVSTAWLLPTTRPLLTGIEIDQLEADPAQWLRLGAAGLLLLIPFFFGACALAIAFTTRVRSVGLLYGANLLGSAAGAAGALGLLTLALPEDLVPLLALALLAAALITAESRRSKLRTTLFAAAALGTLGGAFAPREIPVSAYKGLSYALQLPEAEHSPARPHPLGRMETVRSPALRHAPDLSLRYTGTVPAPETVYVNADTYGHLLDPAAPGADIIAHTPRALPFALRPAGHAVYLAPGGTPGPNLALAQGTRVTVVEPHPHVAARIENLLAPEGVTVVQRNPRAFLMTEAADRPDLIAFPERGIFGGPVGLQALGEDFLFTEEAFAAAFARLAPGGQVAVNVWLDEPLRHAPRIIDLVARALRAIGVSDPARHIAVVRGWGSLSLVASAAPLDETDIEKIRAFAESAGFDVLAPAEARGSERLHGDAGDVLDRALIALTGPDREAFLGNYRLDVAAPADNRPFFNQFVRPADTRAALFATGGDDFATLSVSERGIVVIVLLVALLALASLLLILGPLAAARTPLATTRFTLLYFAGLGAGFMFFEIALIQRFTLIWGSPLHSAAGVIGTLLCGMGIGSALSQRFRPSPRGLAVLATAIAVLQGAILFTLAAAADTLAAAAPAARILGGVLLILPPAVLLGMPFPLGLRLLTNRASGSVPWAWGVNGCLSVLSAPAAGLLALAAGFNSLAAVAAAAYLAASAAALTHREGPG
ncbi:MAG: hypothetical protein JJU00_04785 [Opitutales bacterium]|nr:hypothetical protein [Opitutales bacterium]